MEAKSGNCLTEFEAAKVLDQMRLEDETFLDLSFPTISGFGSNGAIIYYEAYETSLKRKKVKLGSF